MLAGAENVISLANVAVAVAAVVSVSCPGSIICSVISPTNDVLKVTPFVCSQKSAITVYQ